MKQEQIIEDFKTDYHNYMLDENKSKDPEYFGDGLHASSIGYCKRRTVFEYFGFKKRVLPLTTLTTFARGNDVHHEVEAMLRQAKLFKPLHIELDISDGLPDGVKGKLDYIVEHIPTGIIILGDIKSANPKQFDGYKAGYIKLPKQANMNQVSIYAGACDKLGIKYDALSVTYLDKGGTDEPQMFFFSKSLEADFLVEQDLAVIEKYKKDKITPEYHLSSKEAWKCHKVNKFGEDKIYCDFYNIVCKGGDKWQK